VTGDKKDKGRFSLGPRGIRDERIKQMVLDRTPVKVRLDNGYVANARIVGWSPEGHRARVEFDSGSRFTLDKGRVILPGFIPIEVVTLAEMQERYPVASMDDIEYVDPIHIEDFYNGEES
jgi:hypothetical protein